MLILCRPVSTPKKAAPSQTAVKISQEQLHTSYRTEYDSYLKWNKKSRTTVIILALLTFLPIGTLIVGQVHKNDCPIQTWIPRWMTIFGAVGLATFSALVFITVITIVCCSGRARKIGYGTGGSILCLLLLFFFVWLIAGSVWVFSNNAKVQFNQTDSENYCIQSLYKFTFGILLTQYASIGLIIFCGGCFYCYAFCM